MNILVTIGRYWPTIGGGELYTRELIRHMAKRHRVRVVCLRNDNCIDWLYGMTINPQAKQKPYFDGGTKVQLLSLGFSSRFFLKGKLARYYADERHRQSCNRLLARMFKRELMKLDGEYDLIHNVKIGEEFFSLASLDFAREKGIPFVFTPLSHPAVGWRGKLFSHLYQNANALIALTEAEKAFLVTLGAAPDRTHVIGVGPLLANSTPDEDIKRRFAFDGPAILFLGQKYPHKGIGQLLNAAPLVWEKFPEARFIFAGPRVADSKRLFEAIDDPRIIELGTISEQEKANLFSGCDIFCLPSIGESFGMVYLEAWSFRKPVIAADTHTSRCFIQDGYDGLLAKQEPASIATSICRLLKDAALRKKLGENGYRKVTSRYSWPKIASNIESVYNTVIGSRASRGTMDK